MDDSALQELARELQQTRAELVAALRASENEQDEQARNRRKTIAQTQRRAALQEEARYEHLRNDFIAAASHELKTPVTGIELISETLSMALDDGDLEAAEIFLSQIKDEIRKMRQLIEDLLDLSRFDENPDADTVCDLRQVIDTAMTMHRRSAERQGLELDIIIEAGEDEALLARLSATDAIIILDNLMDNALNYTEKGSISLRVSREPEDSDTASFWRVEVSDTGVGIAAADHERVFDRFYRVDNSRSREQGGTGLGLALVKNAVENRGGTVTLTSEPEKGSTFTVLLPIA